MTQEVPALQQLPRASETFFRFVANIAKKPSVLDSGEKFTAITRKIAVWTLGFDVFKRETFDRETREWHWKQYKWGELIPATIEGIQIEGEMALADRVGNETKVRMFNDKKKSKPWKIFERARENSANNDHGWPHERRIERLIEMVIMGVEFLRHGQESIREWIQLPFLYSWNHDMDQAITEQRKIEEGTNLKPKAMHAEAGGVMGWLIKTFVGEAGEIEDSNLRRLSAGLMVANMVHDKPELIDRRLNSPVTAAELRHDQIALLAAWDPKLVPFVETEQIKVDPYQRIKERGVRVLSFTLGDVMTVLRLGKELAGFVSQETPNGLHPDIEGVYKTQLKTMSDDYSQTLGEMIGFKDENDERAFRHTLDICIITDLLDMLVPPGEALIRKFMTPIAWKRPLFRKMPQGQFTNMIINGDGDIPQKQDSDLRRMMWEAFHTFDFLNQSNVGRHPFMQTILDTLLVENVQFIKQIIPALMLNDLVDIEAIFERRASRLKAKGRKRSAFPNFDSEALASALAVLENEKNEVKHILSNKPVADDKGYYDQRDLFLAGKFIVLIESYLKIPENFRPLKLPYSTYDHLGPSRPKVVHKELVN